LFRQKPFNKIAQINKCVNLNQFGITYFSRQFLEPKILSDQMNVHPLITLVFMYAGLKIAGFLGLIVAPIVAFIIKITLYRMKNEKIVEKGEDL
jgi:predicted PurR-regulated permease PerM